MLGQRVSTRCPSTASPNKCITPVKVSSRRCACFASPKEVPATAPNPLAALLPATVLSLGLCFAQVAPAHAASPSTLAELVQDEYGFIDPEKDGVVSLSDLQKLTQQIADEEQLAGVPDESRLEFTLRLFDLNQNGVTTTEEALRSLALDGAVSDDAVDEGAFEVFDRDRDDAISRAEFKQGLGDLGLSGEGMKEYVFDRVNFLTNSKGKLDVTGFGNALALARTQILGY